MVKPNGWLRFHDESNTEPSRQIAPTYWTTTVSPSATVGPVPLIRTWVVRFFGGFPLGILIVGAAPGVAAAVTVGSLPPPCDTCRPAAAAVPEKSLIMSTTNTRVS